MFQLSAVKTGKGGSKMKTKNVFYVSGIIKSNFNEWIDNGMKV